MFLFFNVDEYRGKKHVSEIKTFHSKIKYWKKKAEYCWLPCNFVESSMISSSFVVFPVVVSDFIVVAVFDFSPE